ncbi:TBC1 domain member 7 [Homalodisca vitripennis]|nr:TBC1 domain member 7 [Homalodisca vitripennis]KAG8329870.1 TBC1 domain member 7 [Homalodisca vitripennis]
MPSANSVSSDPALKNNPQDNNNQITNDLSHARGVIPSQKKCHEFIMEERKSQYLDLLECLKAMKYVTHDSPKEQKFLEMWLLEKYNLAFDRNEQVN